MKSFTRAALLMAVALSPIACNKSSEGGAPGTKNTFKISAPSGTVDLTQGEKKVEKVSLDRGTDFKQGVKLSANAPDKLKVDFEKSSIAASDPKDVNMTIEAAKDAQVGEHTITVTATPDTGAPTTVDVKVKVAAAK